MEKILPARTRVGRAVRIAGHIAGTPRLRVSPRRFGGGVSRRPGGSRSRLISHECEEEARSFLTPSYEIRLTIHEISHAVSLLA
ncbi:MAG: hypothetical protein ACM32J_00900 [Rhizobacter sp.]